MRKKVLLPATMIALGAIVASCGTYRESSNKVLPVVVNEVITAPKLIDYQIDFNKKLTSTVSGKIAGKLSMKKYLTPEYYKERAVADAIKSGNADFLVEPSFENDVKKKKVTITVTGYAAKYTGVKDINVKDTTEVKNYLALTNRSADALDRTLGTGGHQYAQGNLFKRMKNNLNRRTRKANQMGL